MWKSLLVLAEEVIKAWLPETQRTYQSQKGFNHQQFLGFNLSISQSKSFIWNINTGYQLCILSEFVMINFKISFCFLVRCCPPISVWVGSLWRPRWASKSATMEQFSYHPWYGIYASSGKTLTFLFLLSNFYFPVYTSYLFISQMHS